MEEKKQDVDKLALKAGGWYVFSSIMLRAILLLTTPIFTRLMSTEDYGVTSTYSSWLSLLVIFCTLNLTYSVGRAKLDFPGKLEEFIGSMQLLTLLISGVIGLVLITFSGKLVNILELPQACIYVLVFQLMADPIINLYINGCRYKYKYKETVAIGWYSSIVSTIVALVLVYNATDNKAYYRILGNMLPVTLLAIFLLAKAIKAGNLKYNREYWKYGLYLSTPLVLHEISHSILSQSDRIFIVKMCGASDTGIYSIAYSYGCLMSVVTGAVSSGWLPWFHDKYYEKKFDEIRKNSKLIVMLGCYIGLACVDLAPEAVAILGGAEYAKGIYCIAPVTLGIVCQYVYTHYVNIEMHLKKTRFVPIGTMIAAATNLILNAIFIPTFGFIAAAYTTFASYLVLMIAHFVYSRYVLKVKLYNDVFMFLSIIVTAIIAGILAFSYNYTWLRYLLLGVGFISFLCVYNEFIKKWIKKRGNS